MNNQFNEEEYQKRNAKIKIAGVLVILLGLALIAGGVYFIYKSSQIEVPPMGADNWFEIKSSQSHTQMGGIFMMLPGIFLTIVGIMIRFVIANHRQILTHQFQSMIPAMTEAAEEMAPTIKKLAKDMKDDVDTW